MQVRKYQVECLDRDTGAKTIQVLDGLNAQAVSELANRMGFLVGSVDEMNPTPAVPVAMMPKKRAPRKWLWFLFGTVFGIATTMSALVVLAIIGSAQSRHELSRFGIDREADRVWADEWPKLSFPVRPTTGNPQGVSVKYDEFRDNTTFESEFDLAPCLMTVSATEKGRLAFPKQPPRTVSIMLYRKGEAFDGELILLVDGSRIVLKDRNAGRDAAFFDLETRDLLRIAQAKEVRGRFGINEFSMNTEGISKMRGLVSMLRR